MDHVLDEKVIYQIVLSLITLHSFHSGQDFDFNKIFFEGGIDSLNKARNEQYYADLQKHQQDLMQYGEKQMEFLDQQRRYQQAVLDQRAGAAVRVLLMPNC